MAYSCRVDGHCPGVRLKQAGFTLIEVIVALVILATSGLALFAWINQNLATASRLRESEVRSQLQVEGVSWIATINPAVEPDGQREQDGLVLAWHSMLVEESRSEFDFSGNVQPRWMLSLYRIEASLTRQKDGLKVEWSQVAAGWVPLNGVVVRPSGA